MIVWRVRLGEGSAARVRYFPTRAEAREFYYAAPENKSARFSYYDYSERFMPEKIILTCKSRFIQVLNETANGVIQGINESSIESNKVSIEEM